MSFQNQKKKPTQNWSHQIHPSTAQLTCHSSLLHSNNLHKCKPMTTPSKLQSTTPINSSANTIQKSMLEMTLQRLFSHKPQCGTQSNGVIMCWDMSKSQKIARFGKTSSNFSDHPSLTQNCESNRISAHNLNFM